MDLISFGQRIPDVYELCLSIRQKAKGCFGFLTKAGMYEIGRIADILSIYLCFYKVRSAVVESQKDSRLY